MTLRASWMTYVGLVVTGGNHAVDDRGLCGTDEAGRTILAARSGLSTEELPLEDVAARIADTAQGHTSTTPAEIGVR